MIITVENIEIFLLVLVRISGFIYSAPIFSLKNIPMKLKVGLSVFITLIIFSTTTFYIPEYNNVIELAIMIVKEAIAGVTIGFFANLAYYIISFVGQLIDLEIGFSMSNIFDPISKTQATISANFYGYLIILMMIITNLHHHFIYAIIDSFKIITLGKININPNLHILMLKFVVDYFVVGFRIVLPIFATILIVNTVMAILAKVAPQMNLFAIGIQIKVLVGLSILFFMIGFLPSIADFIFNIMMKMLKSSMEYLVM